MKSLSLSSIAALLLAGILTMSATTGVDSFQIYLNNKLVVSHMLTEPLTVQSLKLTHANADDQLKIVYMQCNAPDKTGKNRIISLTDEQGSVVMEWKFNNRSGTHNTMVIPVKELLAAQQKSGGRLVLNYSADDLGRYQQLAAI
jgi:hypothetical protein